MRHLSVLLLAIKDAHKDLGISSDDGRLHQVSGYYKAYLHDGWEYLVSDDPFEFPMQMTIGSTIYSVIGIYRRGGSL
jgi:hypothetical protein